jgi:hypothetical protein
MLPRNAEGAKQCPAPTRAAERGASFESCGAVVSATGKEILIGVESGIRPGLTRWSTPRLEFNPERA